MDEMITPPQSPAPKRQNGQASRPGFTLIELLLVVSIVIILAGLMAPAFRSMMTGTNLSRAGQLVGDHLSLARQEAITRNQQVEVRFFYFTNGVWPGWQALQVFRMEQTPRGESRLIPASKFTLLPEGVLISSNERVSPLFKACTTGQANVARFGSTPIPYASFRFRANGATDSAITDANNFITLKNAQDPGEPPPNYYTIQINPVTGKVTVFRP